MFYSMKHYAARSGERSSLDPVRGDSVSDAQANFVAFLKTLRYGVEGERVEMCDDRRYVLASASLKRRDDGRLGWSYKLTKIKGL